MLTSPPYVAARRRCMVSPPLHPGCVAADTLLPPVVLGLTLHPPELAVALSPQAPPPVLSLLPGPAFARW
jgi:hypothetical protein